MASKEKRKSVKKPKKVVKIVENESINEDLEESENEGIEESELADNEFENSLSRK